MTNREKTVEIIKGRNGAQGVGRNAISALNFLATQAKAANKEEAENIFISTLTERFDEIMAYASPSSSYKVADKSDAYLCAKALIDQTDAMYNFIKAQGE